MVYLWLTFLTGKRVFPFIFLKEAYPPEPEQWKRTGARVPQRVCVKGPPDGGKVLDLQEQQEIGGKDDGGCLPHVGLDTPHP